MYGAASPPIPLTMEQEPIAVFLKTALELCPYATPYLMMVGYISAVYMYTTEKLPAAQSFPAKASAVLTMKHKKDITFVNEP